MLEFIFEFSIKFCVQMVEMLKFSEQQIKNAQESSFSSLLQDFGLEIEGAFVARALDKPAERYYFTQL